jgi:hypothetical protein
MVEAVERHGSARSSRAFLPLVLRLPEAQRGSAALAAADPTGSAILPSGLADITEEQRPSTINRDGGGDCSRYRSACLNAMWPPLWMRRAR